ncbi:hypothetical protein MMC25_004434 [Agyrium rufum]|nr:hypothetical protein [Agyrium rufum]
MARTNTSGRRSFTRKGSVRYDLPTEESTSITITLPPGSTWTSGLHWHETHTEFIKIVQGKALVTLGTLQHVYEPKDGVIQVERYEIHEWGRAPAEEEQATEEDLIVEEWNYPADGEKELFFRNLNSVVSDCSRTKPGPFMTMDAWIDWQILAICHDFDNYPVYLSNFYLRWAATHVILFITRWLGFLFLGIRGRYEEYSPKQVTKAKLQKKPEDEEESKDDLQTSQWRAEPRRQS